MSSRDKSALAAAVLAAIVGVGLTAFMGMIAFALSLALIMLSQPLLRAYAMARPNARSSHKLPVPQGAGGPIVLATAVSALLFVTAARPDDMPLVSVLSAALLLAIVGCWDDLRSLAVTPRLLLQFLAVALLVFSVPSEWRLLPSSIPIVVEKGLLVVTGVWLVNLTNFIDGIDGITVAGLMPLSAAALWFADFGAISQQGKILAGCFLAAQAAFVFFNWNQARLFLGDIGSLPMGLLAGGLLYDLAAHGAWGAALILPMLQGLDATSTLLMRLRRREKVWIAHREHAYQIAVDGGLSHNKVSGLVLLFNLLMIGLAYLSIGQSGISQGLYVLLAFLLASALLVVFRKRVGPA